MNYLWAIGEPDNVLRNKAIGTRTSAGDKLLCGYGGALLMIHSPNSMSHKSQGIRPDVGKL